MRHAAPCRGARRRGQRRGGPGDFLELGSMCDLSSQVFRCSVRYVKNGPRPSISPRSQSGRETELHICEHCASEQGIATHSQMSINELLSHLLAVQPSDEEMFGPAEKELVCPTCGFTLDRLRKEGTLGCPADYEVFEQALLPLIERAHGGKTSHCGKVPDQAAHGHQEIRRAVAAPPAVGGSRARRGLRACRQAAGQNEAIGIARRKVKSKRAKGRRAQPAGVSPFFLCTFYF